MTRRTVLSLLVLAPAMLPLASCRDVTPPTAENAIFAKAVHATAAVTGTITRLSSGSADNQQNQPTISGTNVVWTNAAIPVEGATNFDIYYYDIQSGNAVNLTNSPNEQEFLEDVDGSTVVWTRTNSGTPGDIVAYDLNANVLSTVATSGVSTYFQQPAIRGQWITFLRVANQIDVYLYDNLTGTPIGLVTNDAAVQAHPRVGGGLVVFEDYGSGNADIMGYNIPSGPVFPIATGAAIQITPDVDGNTVVYVQNMNGADQVFAYDIAARTTRQLTNSASSKVLPRISGRRVVWSDDRNGNLDLYFYDLGTNTESPLVTGSGDQFLSDIDGDRVVFTDNASGFEQVFLFTFTEQPPPPPPTPQTKDDCKNDGWRRFGFKNQGQCVSFVVSKRVNGG